jgi:hypothetical protein
MTEFNFKLIETVYKLLRDVLQLLVETRDKKPGVVPPSRCSPSPYPLLQAAREFKAKKSCPSCKSFLIS